MSNANEEFKIPPLDQEQVSHGTTLLMLLQSAALPFT